MGKREIKCPHCNSWTIWKEKLYDRCEHCNGLIKQERICKLNNFAKQTKAEEEIELLRSTKQNPILKKAGSYAASISIGFILIITAIIVLAAG